MFYCNPLIKMTLTYVYTCKSRGLPWLWVHCFMSQVCFLHFCLSAAGFPLVPAGALGLAAHLWKSSSSVFSLRDSHAGHTWRKGPCSWAWLSSSLMVITQPAPGGILVFVWPLMFSYVLINSAYITQPESPICFLPRLWLTLCPVCHFANKVWQVFNVLFSSWEMGLESHWVFFCSFVTFMLEFEKVLFLPEPRRSLLFLSHFELRQNLKVFQGIFGEGRRPGEEQMRCRTITSSFHQNSFLFISSWGWASL